MDYIYGSLNEDIEPVEYEGKETRTAKTIIDQDERTIAVDVKKVPNALTLINGNEEIVYDGSSVKRVEIEGKEYIAGEGINISDKTISVDDGAVMRYTMTEPTQDNLNGIIMAVLTQKPTKRYKGYIYVLYSPSDPSVIEGTKLVLGSDSYVLGQRVVMEEECNIDNHSLILE